MSAASQPRIILAIDSGSPLVSVALGVDADVAARRSMAMEHSSEALLRRIDEVLGEANVRLDQVGGLLGLRGPGSFTGLRVGLSTLLGLHQALKVPATALPTLDVLRLAAPAEARRVATVVDALRGEWFVKVFEQSLPEREEKLLTAPEILRLDLDYVVGHGAAALRDELTDSTRVVEGPELAPLALRLAMESPPEWNPATLLEPLYLRPPSVKASRSPERSAGIRVGTK